MGEGTCVPLTPLNRYAERLQELLELNTPLATVYLLKEELRRFWDQPDRTTGKAFLEAWRAKALATDLKPLKQMAKTLKQHGWGILNYFEHPLTSGLVEGLNNKIKVMLRKQYGLRDQEYLELKLLNIQSARLALIG